MPILCNVSPPIVLAILVSWSLLEIFASKHRFGLRSLQIVQLLLSPLVGAIMGLAIAQATDVPGWVVGLLGGSGGLAGIGFTARAGGMVLPIERFTIVGNFSTGYAVYLPGDACLRCPKQGGIIALLLLWLAIRTSKNWQRWYRQQAHPQQKNPRRYLQDPD
ncbi:MAG: DUF4126 domain-containing protein [Leptolyngbyaceae cyanobacterium SU_3_3]|nr:DUF4126 domain-containing protein [Leptolyngbyaceae cyanobacterium SU_3_3]